MCFDFSMSAKIIKQTQQLNESKLYHVLQILAGTKNGYYRSKLDNTGKNMMPNWMNVRVMNAD